jgi:hypothetical protein
MPEFDNLAQLELYVNQLAKEAMTSGNAVKETVIQTGERHVETDVYNKYTPNPNNPLAYKRTGKLKSGNWKTNPTADGIEIYDDRTDQGRDVTAIVATGKGYQYDFPYNGVPRPFIENTVDELRGGSELTNALKMDLKTMGVDVE